MLTLCYITCYCYVLLYNMLLLFCYITCCLCHVIKHVMLYYITCYVHVMLYNMLCLCHVI